jgi:hypothetical protein
VNGSPKALHEACDLLLAQYLLAHPKALPSTISVMELLTWNHARCEPGIAVSGIIEELGALATMRRAAKKAGFKV